MQKCSECGKEIDGNIVAARIDGEFSQFCSDCKSVLDKIGKCDRCKEHYTKGLISIDSNGRLLAICPSCKPSYGRLSTCDKCDKLSTQPLKLVKIEGKDVSLCQDCFQESAHAREESAKAKEEALKAETQAENKLKLSDLNSNKNIDDISIVEALELSYRKALVAIDTDVPARIAAGKEMAAIRFFNVQLTIILDVLETVNILYSTIYNSKNLLAQFDSERLRQYGNELIPTRYILKDLGSEEEIEGIVNGHLACAGFKREHWYIKGIVISEIEYMLDALGILIEPDYVPLEGKEDKEETSEDKTNRYVPATVKRAVWRRDLGKCVECGTKDKLEYDHIIPVAKGGSSTERNIQLLCEQCNRKKSANIQ